MTQPQFRKLLESDDYGCRWPSLAGAVLSAGEGTVGGPMGIPITGKVNLWGAPRV